MGLVVRSRKERWIQARSRAYRAAGLHRWADILYVRLLEGWLRPRSIEALYDTARSLEGDGAIVEIGSFKGKSAVALARATKRSGRPRPVYAIDPHPDRGALRGTSWPAFLETLREAEVDDAVEPLRMESLRGARVLAERGVRIALLFVDGAHDEESVVADLEAFLPLLAPQAWIAMDDARPGGKFPGVFRAWQRVLAERSTPPVWASSLLLARLLDPLPGTRTGSPAG